MNNRLPPGPRDLCFGLKLLREQKRDYLGFWSSAQKTYGDVIYMRLVHLRNFAFMHPDQIREVLVDEADSFIRYERHMEVLGQLHGQSVLITEGELWKKQRRTLLPGFSPKRFSGYARQMTEAVAEMLTAIPGDGDTPLDFEHVMNVLSMDVILRTMFSSKIGQATSDIENAVRTLSQNAYEEMFDPMNLPDWLPLPGKAAKRKALRLLDSLTWSHIRERRHNPQEQHDLLSLLLTVTDDNGDGSVLSDIEVRDQLMTTFLAGHETTAAGMTWAGWLLAAHPAVAKRAAQEVDQVLAGRNPVFADCVNLPYLGRIIKETLRLYPPAPGVFMRRAVQDVQIGEWMVPKGAVVTLLSILPHHDERWFSDPNRFDPDRFEAEASKAIPRGAYFPFGTGPRVCIGNNFATMEMTLILAMLIQRFTLRPAPGQTQPGFRLQVTLRPAGGVRLVLEKRSVPLSGTTPAAIGMATASGCPFHTTATPPISF